MDRMRNSSGSRAQRYRPASEFDEATLTRKREYWRTKKREQRAKLSVLKKEGLKAESTRICTSRASTKHLTGDENGSLTLPPGVPGPTLLNSDGTYQTGQRHNPSHLFEKSSLLVEIEENAGPTSSLSSEQSATVQSRAVREGQLDIANQKDRWFQKIKLNTVLPQFPATSSDSTNNLKGAVASRKTISCLSVGAVSGTFASAKLNGVLLDSCSQLPAIQIKASSVHSEVRNKNTLLNGSSSILLPQHNLALQAASGNTPLNILHPCVQVESRASQITSDIPVGVKVTELSPGPESGQANVPEIPRSIEMLKTNIKKEVDNSFLDTDSPTTTNSNNEAVFSKAGELNNNETMKRVSAGVHLRGPMPNTEGPAPVAPHQFLKPTVWRQKLLDGNERWSVVQSRMQRQRLIDSQRMISQRSARRFFSPAVALTTRKAQKGRTEETEEERMARKREYWRIKKREQRAKLSVEVKTKMKERDSLLRRVKRYQCILNEMRRARTGSNKVQQASCKGNTLPSDNETISGFIKEDGTMTTNIPQASADHRLAGQEISPESHTFSSKLIPDTSCSSSNAILRKQVHITAPPPLKSATQIKGTCHPNAMSFLNPPRLISNKVRHASHTIPKNLQNPHTTIRQTNSSLRRLHNVQSTYPRLTLVKQRHSLPQISRVVGKYSATRLEEGQGSKPAAFVLKGVSAGSASATMAPTMVPELTEEERMAKKREYWRIKKREQRANRSARARQTLSSCKYNTAIQLQQSQRALSARRAAGLLSLRGISANCSTNNALMSKPNIPISTQDKQGNIKQEEELAPTGDMCPDSDPPLCCEIKPSLSPAAEQQVEQDPSASMDSQATTLLAVASMKKLLEESLSSVADCNGLPPCKSEQVSSEEDVVKLEVKPSLPLPSAGGEGHVVFQEKHHSAPGFSLQSPELHPYRVQSSSCQKPPHILSTCQDQSSQSPACNQTALQFPSSNQTYSNTPLSSQSPTHAPSCCHATSSGQPLQPRRAQRKRAKKIGHCCSPEPPKQPSSSPPQPNEDLLWKKREHWRIAKREQRAKKAAREREMRRLGEQGRRQIARASQGTTICVVKKNKPDPRIKGNNLHSSPALHTTNSTPILLSSAAGTLTCLKAATTLPILKVVTPTPPSPGLNSDTLKNKAPATEPSGTSSRQVVPDGYASLNCSTVPCPAGHESSDGALSDSIGSTGRLLLFESQQNKALGSNPESPQVKHWRLQVPESMDTASSKSVSTSKNPSLMLQFGKMSSHGGKEMSAGQPHSQNPPSCNILPCVKHEEACKSPDPLQLTQAPDQLEEDLLRKKREYWRVKKKEQRARKAAREREMKRQGVSGGCRPILPAKELPKSLEQQGQLSNQWFNCESKDSQLLPSISSDAEFSILPQLCLSGAVKDDLEMGIEAGEEEEEEEEEEEDGHSDAPSSEAFWRTRFLMDFDPLNQLLVCMVCGELQHSHSLAGVRGHIKEAHPDTLSLDPQDRRRILEAWDEQVFLRERFFSNQLQQHSCTLTGESQECPAEVEVLVDLEESPALKNGKMAKTKSPKKV